MSVQAGAGVWSSSESKGEALVMPSASTPHKNAPVPFFVRIEVALSMLPVARARPR